MDVQDMAPVIAGLIIAEAQEEYADLERVGIAIGQEPLTAYKPYAWEKLLAFQTALFKAFREILMYVVIASDRKKLAREYRKVALDQLASYLRAHGYKVIPPEEGGGEQ